MGNSKWTALPILDISRLEAGAAEKEAFLAELRHTAHDLGFFYLTGHGVDPELIRRVLTLSRQFFNLPEEEKLAIEMANSPHFRGYTRLGWERTRGQRDWREQIDIGDERPALPRDTGLPAWYRLQGPNQWPQSLPELREVILEYKSAVAGVALRVIRAFSAALGQSETVFDSIFTPDGVQLLKLIRYPGREATDSDQGVGAHKDGGFVTVLLQDVEEGLQVEYEGNWIDAPPIPGTFVINIGEVLELATNGYLRANVHRVNTPRQGIDRLSVAFFFGAKLDATVPLLKLPPELAEGVRGLTVDPLNPLFYEVGKNNLKGRLRSHPDVARRHYADLLEQEASENLASSY
ncbi:MAG: isopenicillin N synthase family oxygenase [Chloroflexi bacterium]|uniref:Isopenicillin N synthase family oxygenase n=1 Tax=Candidatus Chlorohelix allophototropha TaxID=3003348 RepID=A0A8T7M477_9CHLR|nr:isopenicillin N synthase family oxygenase [Chloroflexota bacterium]WJW70134.1 isopenicillin N synthase family oxygenase [Chloroflexota bacterium L227-S17]